MTYSVSQLQIEIDKLTFVATTHQIELDAATAKAMVVQVDLEADWKELGLLKVELGATLEKAKSVRALAEAQRSELEVSLIAIEDARAEVWPHESSMAEL